MISNTLYDFCNKVKRQCINFSLFNAASLGQYIRHVFPFIVYYFLGMGKSCLPLNITIELNYDCNLRCKFCFLNFTSKDTYAEKKAYLTYADIKQILTMFSRKGVAFLLTGGELALRSDLPDILKLIKQNKIKCGIFTNATLLNSIVSDCIIEYGLDFIYFSLDGPQDIHDKLRGDNAFDRTYKNIRYLSGNRKDLRPKIIMNSLILQENYKNLTEVIDIACELKIDGIAFDFLTFLSSDELTLHQNSFIKRFPRDKYKSFVYAHDFLDTEFKDLLSIIRVVKMYAKKRRMKIFFKPELKDSEISMWFSRDFRFERRCIYPWSVLRISPYGDIFPCAQFCIKMGNIRDNSIKDIWNSGKFIHFRNALQKEKLFPGCNRCVKL